MSFFVLWRRPPLPHRRSPRQVRVWFPAQVMLARKDWVLLPLPGLPSGVFLRPRVPSRDFAVLTAPSGKLPNSAVLGAFSCIWNVPSHAEFSCLLHSRPSLLRLCRCALLSFEDVKIPLSPLLRFCLKMMIEPAAHVPQIRLRVQDPPAHLSP